MSEEDVDAVLEDSVLIDEHIHQNPADEDDYFVLQLHKLPDGRHFRFVESQA